MRPSTVLIGLACVSFVLLSALALDLAEPRAPSSARCAELWNEATNRGNRSMAAAAGFDGAVVAGSLTMETFPGCEDPFRGSDAEPWLVFMGPGQLHTGRVERWDLVTGRKRGSDSPDGGPETPNATVTDDGRVRLDGG